MNRFLVVVAVTVLCMGLATAPAWATIIFAQPDPVAIRVAKADCVVVGKVASIEDKPVSAPRFIGSTDKAEFRIAVIKISEGLQGTDGAKEVRVGFLPPLAAVGPGIGVVPGPGLGAPTSTPLAVGQEGCFFLNKYAGTDFYFALGNGGLVEKMNRLEYPGTLTEARRIAKLLADPKAALTARLPLDRFVAACLLIQRYRTPRVTDKTEPIDAEESKLLLKALADYDYNPNRRVSSVPLFYPANPHLVLDALGVKEKDGWKPPMNFRNATAAARTWMRENVEKFRVEKFVAEDDQKNAKKTEDKKPEEKKPNP